MAEVLRDLVVSLSLQTDNFSRNITSINRQVREAESSFRLAGAGIDNVGRTTEGLSSRISMLQMNLGRQKDMVAQYEMALAQANTRLQESYARYQEYSTRLDEAKRKHQELGQAIKEQEEYLKLIEQLTGRDCDAYRAESEELQRLKTEYAASGAEVKKLSDQCNALQKTMQRAADGVSTAQTNLNNAKAQVKETTAEIKKAEEQLKKLNEQLKVSRSHWTTAGTALTSFSKRMTALGKNATKLGRQMTMYLTAPIVALGKKIVQAFLDFEWAFPAAS